MIVTIGRQYGSGGKEIGEKLAARLGYAFYDREILTMAAENKGFSAEAMENYDEKPTNSLIYSMYMTSTATSEDLPLNQQLAYAQFNVIRKVAQEDNCVIVGRCADYVLQGRTNLVTVFFHAPMEYRVQRIMEEESLSKTSLAERSIKKHDKSRADYYNFFTHKKWGEAGSYMISLDTSVMPPDRIVDVLAEYVKAMQEK